MTLVQDRTVFPEGIEIGNGVSFVEGSGAPTDGTSGTLAGFATIGSLYLDRVGGVLYINSGTLASPSWEPAAGGGSAAGVLEARNETGVAFVAGDLVYISGWNDTQDKPLLTKADADAQGRPAEYVVRESIANNANGLVGKQFRGAAQSAAADLDLAGATVGDPIFLSTTAGDATLVDPTDADPNGISQIVARVAVVATDIAEFFISNPVQIGTNEIQDDAITTAKIVDSAVNNAKIDAAAAIARSKLAQDAISSGFRIPFSQFRVFDAMQTLLPGTAGSDDMGLIGGTHGTASPLLEGVAVAAGSSETQNARVTVCLPAEYDAGQTITLRVTSRMTAAMNTAETIDAAVHRNDNDGTVSADLVTTAAITTDQTFTDHDFTIDPTGLVAGDELDILITSVADDGGGAGTGRFQCSRVELLVDIKG